MKKIANFFCRRHIFSIGSEHLSQACDPLLSIGSHPLNSEVGNQWYAQDVIEAMYPQQVAQRLLTGDQRIVYHVPNATVFFGDIYEFTAGPTLFFSTFQNKCFTEFSEKKGDNLTPPPEKLTHRTEF